MNRVLLSLCLLFLSFVIGLFKILHYSQRGRAGIGSFLDVEGVEECMENLRGSDEDGDEKIGADEFLNFVQVQSNGNFRGDSFRDIPVEFVSLFTETACSCLEEKNALTDCCEEDNAHIVISGEETPQREAYLSKFCLHFLQTEDFALHRKEPSKSPIRYPSPKPQTTPGLKDTSSATIPSIAPAMPLPSPKPSAIPTILAYSSTNPSLSPSLPTIFPTIDTLTSEQILQVQYQYGLTNDQGLNADAILNNVGNNGLKDGLIIATRTILIQTLNSTFSRSLSLPKFLKTSNGESQLKNGIMEKDLLSQSKSMAIPLNEQQNTVKQPQQNEQQRQRHLAFYTDHLPITIDEVLNNRFNPLCTMSTDTNLRCVMIFSTISVILGAGEDKGMVSTLITNGLETARADGRFAAAIP